MAASEGATVGVVGDAGLAAEVAAATESATAGDAEAVLAAGPEWVVAGGDAALVDLLAAAVSVPVLAVDADAGVPSVRRDRVGEAVAAVAAGDARSTTRRLLAARVDGEHRATMLRDAMLITGEPARISEYAVHSAEREVARFRADGVAVATPAGSPGYVSDAGGPVVKPGTASLAVVPVAPFRTASDHWVLEDGAVSLSVHREEHVVLVVDGRERGRVSSGATVALAPTGALSLYAPPGLEKL
jgi:NAD+ kinase